MNWKATFAAAALAWVPALGAQAGVVLSDNFNTGPFGPNWTGDSMFSSPASYPFYTGTNANASTDHTGPGFFGSLCQGGVGGCVDLDGSTGSGNDPAGVLESLTSFGPGTYTLTFDLAGNQRGGSAETTDVYFGGDLIDSITLSSSDPWTLHHVTFTAGAGGNLTFLEVGPSDNVGNVLDNVTLSTGTPEPATWALMLAGFACLGGVLRSRHGMKAGRTA